MTGRRLRPDVTLSVAYGDDTPLGTPVSPRLEANLAVMFAPIVETANARGVPYVVEHSRPLLRDLRERLQAAGILERTGCPRIAPAILHPDPGRARPSGLTLHTSDGAEGLRLDCEAEHLPGLHDLMTALYAGGSASDASSGARVPVHGDLVTELSHRGLLIDPESMTFDASGREPEAWRSAEATVVGHNTVVVRSRSTRVIVDPWLTPRAARYPADYQPVLRGELGRIDAILITHSHPDHFVPGTLLQFDRATTVVVPRVEHESLLAVDLGLRLRELGFTDVRTVGWWEGLRVGDIDIVALPFYGEQPTTGAQLCPEVRNAGNTYLVRTPGFSCALIADSGRDRAGDVRDVAVEAFRRWGAIDVLFAGYRGWSLYPIQYAASSVRAYLLLVPPELDAVRQSIMNSPAEAVDTAEAWHARHLVPYADGGAPWHWEIGLGPDLRSNAERRPREWKYFDPLPESCLEALRVRSAPTRDSVVGSPVRPLLVRPGQSIRMVGGAPEIFEVEGHRWPWEAGGDLPDASSAATGGRRSCFWVA